MKNTQQTEGKTSTDGVGVTETQIKNKTKVLDKVIEELKEISKQWEEKKLPMDFFVLPYELDELICKLEEAQ